MKMPTVIKLVGAAVALGGLLAKIQEFRSAPAASFFSGFSYVVLVTGLALVVLGFAFNFFINSEKNGTPPGRSPEAKDRSSSAV
jgi:phosphotransferase system  glucose/maltose/N-acetylglucosamine-specific IIC component